MAEEYPEFQLQLPRGGPLAHGRLLHEKGTNGSQKFVVLAGSPARAETVPSFRVHMKSSNASRERIIAAGGMRESETWPGYLETTEDITCNSPSAAAEILLGRSANGWREWTTADGFPLSDYLKSSSQAAQRTWLVRGSNVAGFDLVQRLWLPDGLVRLAGTRLREGIDDDLTKDRLRAVVEEDYESILAYTPLQQLVDELHAFLSKMKPGDTVCTISNGHVYVGEIAGDVTQIASEGGRSNLRRPAEWQSVGYPYEELPEELQQKLSIQQDVVDLTTVAGLSPGSGAAMRNSLRRPTMRAAIPPWRWPPSLPVLNCSCPNRTPLLSKNC